MLPFADGLTTATARAPLAPQSTLIPSADGGPLSNRKLKAAAKAIAWQQKLAERRAEAEAAGTLDAYEAAKPVAPAANKRKAGDDPEADAKKKQKRDKKKKNKDPNGAKRTAFHAPEIPLLNGMPAIAKKQKKEVPQTGPSNSQLKAQAEKLLEGRKKLPVWNYAGTIRSALTERDVLLLLGATGSGKSTQLPQFLQREEWNDKCIAITQPRKVAATNLARRVAAEMGVRLGEEVGYSVRFDAKYGKDTKVKYLTDGMLLQEMLRDPELKRYSCVVVDEAHERTVDTDLVLGFLKRLVLGSRKGSLKVVVMSATLEVEGLARFFEENGGEGLGEVEDMGEKKEDEEKPVEVVEVVEETPAPGEKKKKRKKNKKDNIDALLRERTPPPPEPTAGEKEEAMQLTPIEDPTKKIQYFGSVALFQVPGRQFPVTIFHAPEAVDDHVDAALRTIFQIHYSQPLPGDILVFLTGQDEIESLKTLIESMIPDMAPGVPKLAVLPLYAALPAATQQLVFEPLRTPNTRKIILSTNIAETSVTVSGVHHVVDSGLAKQKQYRPGINLESLLSTPISKSSAQQRAGRAGRECPGTCYRLYTATDFSERPDATAPEILRCDLAHPILRLKSRGVEDITSFPYLSPPPRATMLKALETLFSLSALSDSGAITPLGTEMSHLPVTPLLARTLIASKTDELDCPAEVIDVASALSVENLLPQPLGDEDRESFDEARREFARREGDHIMLLELVRAYLAQPLRERKTWCEKHFVNARAMAQVLKIRQQLREYLKLKEGAAEEEEEAGSAKTISPDLAQRVLKAFLAGYFANTARWVGGREWKMVLGGMEVGIHPGSTLFGEKREAVVFHEAVWTSRGFVRWCSGVEMGWIVDAAPGYLKRGI